MTSRFSSLGRLTAVLALITAPATLSAQCGITQPLGANLGATDDSVSGAQTLGFNFPFNATTYDTVYVSSNGFLYLATSLTTPPTGAKCCNGDSGLLLGDPLPMVCAAWMDLYPPGGGSVNFNTFTSPNRATITWDQVPEYTSGGSNTFQITLYDTGQMDFFWEAGCTNVSHTLLVGWSEGGGAADPGASDFSAAPFGTAGVSCYELFSSGTFDVGGRGITAIPSSATSYLVVGATCASANPYGNGCPEPGSAYEQFAGSTFDMSGTAIRAINTGTGYLMQTCSANCWEANYTNNLSLGDDDLATGLPLGFSFPFTGGSTGTVDVCSNGYVWMNSSNANAADWSPTVAELLGSNARICPVWMDLNPNAGGSVYFDTFPGRAVITWDGVFAYGTTNPNTMQLQLFANGDFIVNWQSVNNNATTSTGTAIFGYSYGNGAVDPGLTDFSSSLPFVTPGAIPTGYRAVGGTRPVLGSVFNAEGYDLPLNTALCVANYGFTNPGLSLAVIGMPGCTLLADVLFSLPVTLTLPIGSTSFFVPNIPTIIGASLRTQLAGLAPGINAAGLFTTNGLELKFGN